MEGELVLIRTRMNDEKIGVFGSLLLNGHFICHTLENKAKIIPTGLYFIENSKSPKFKRELPLIYSAEVPAKRGIRIHCGNDAAKDSQGCILVGMKRSENRLIDSSNAETMVTMICRNCKHLTITEMGE
jgi:hypothetical protein